MVRIILHPKLPIKSGIIAIPSTSESELGRALSAHAISLPPGELFVEMDENGTMYIHSLDVDLTEKQAGAAQEVQGDIRLPDVYTRLHATGMVSIFGVVLLLVASAAWTPVSWGHALVLILFLLAAGPPTAHAIASAAHRIGLPRKGALRDDLAGDGNKAGNQFSE